MLQESWEVNTKTKESVVSYVLSIRDKLDTTYSLVAYNLRKAQRVQKTWYDCNACHRQFDIGDQVLVLSPTDSNKLWAQWQGPYPIIQQTGPVDYCVDMYDHRKRKRVFHINMLRKWCSAQQTEGVNLVEQVGEHILAEDVPTWQPATTDKSGASTLGST